MKSLFLSAGAALLACSLGASAAAEPTAGRSDQLVGLWKTVPGSILQMYPCRQGRVCGRLLYSPKSRLENGELRPNAFDASKPMCGSDIVFDLRPDGPGMWKGGTVLDVEKGRKASVRVRLKSENVAEARFYKGISLLGVTEVLTRTSEPAPPC